MNVEAGMNDLRRAGHLVVVSATDLLISHALTGVIHCALINRGRFALCAGKTQIDEVKHNSEDSSDPPSSSPGLLSSHCSHCGQILLAEELVARGVAFGGATSLVQPQDQRMLSSVFIIGANGTGELVREVSHGNKECQETKEGKGHVELRLLRASSAASSEEANEGYKATEESQNTQAQCDVHDVTFPGTLQIRCVRTARTPI